MHVPRVLFTLVLSAITVLGQFTLPASNATPPTADQVITSTNETSTTTDPQTNVAGTDSHTAPAEPSSDEGIGNEKSETSPSHPKKDAATPAVPESSVHNAPAPDTAAAASQPVNVSISYARQHDGYQVTATLNRPVTDAQYRWLAYNLATDTWETFQDWQTSPSALWQSKAGNYWLHLEVRLPDGSTTSSTMSFVYPHLNGSIDSTYANWRTDSAGRKGVLLGNYSLDAAKVVTKIYDVTAQMWVAAFEGTWNYWYPREGVYWTHFEAYDSYGDLSDTRTYAFGVGLDASLSGTAILNEGGGSFMFGGTTANPVGSVRALVYDVSAGAWIWSSAGTWTRWQAPHTGTYWVQIQSLYSDGSLADSKTYPFNYSIYPWWYDPSNPPLFTYGTLRQGARAHYQLGAYNHLQAGKVVGEELWMFPSSAGKVSTWPWAVPGSSSARLVGDIVNYPASTASANLARVDRYEGAAAAHESARNYNRVLRQTEEGMNVWVYESTSWRQAYLHSTGYRVPSGDWFRR